MAGALAAAALLSAGPVAALARPAPVSLAPPAPADERVEPRAGAWTTWVLASPGQVRPPAPPAGDAARAELEEVRALARQRTEDDLAQIRYWDAGAPSYRWVELALAQAQRKPQGNPRTARLLALLNVAVYDATVAAWDAKYAFDRPRPGEYDRSLDTVLTAPRSPAYPSEHAVAAGAATAILGYVYPDDADMFRARAEEAARSRVLAGVQFPSDAAAGLELGRAVAALVIERAETDGSDVRWEGAVPTEPGRWTGTNPVEPLHGTWRTWALSAGDQFRPGPPLPPDSEEKAAELAQLRGTRTFDNSARAYYWQTFEGIFDYWYTTAHQRLFEYKLDANPPRAAHAYALLSVAHYDASVACWDAKYAYWAPRPFQLDAALAPLFATPNHPSYPAAHGCYSGAIAAVLAHLFPAEAEAITAKADEAALSRQWAGIHFPSDTDAGLALGRAVAAAVIERGRSDRAR